MKHKRKRMIVFRLEELAVTTILMVTRWLVPTVVLSVVRLVRKCGRCRERWQCQEESRECVDSRTSLCRYDTKNAFDWQIHITKVGSIASFDFSPVMRESISQS